jgi:hypothetical protein
MSAYSHIKNGQSPVYKNLFKNYFALLQPNHGDAQRGEIT